MSSISRILFVCMGNICRSPAAECTLRHFSAREEDVQNLEIDSAGTIDLHAGNPPDTRMSAAGKARGLTISGSARHVNADDLESFDLILAMDEENLAYLRTLDGSGHHHPKIKLFREFCEKFGTGDVPDPYYGGHSGFVHVLDIIADGSYGILNYVRSQRSKSMG